MHTLEKELFRFAREYNTKEAKRVLKEIFALFGDSIIPASVYAHNFPNHTSLDEMDRVPYSTWFNEHASRSNPYLRVRGTRLILDIERTLNKGIIVHCIIKAHRKAMLDEGFSLKEMRMGTRGTIELVIDTAPRGLSKAAKRTNAKLISLIIACIGVLIALIASMFSNIAIAVIGCMFILPYIALTILYWVYPLKKKKSSKSRRR